MNLNICTNVHEERYIHVDLDVEIDGDGLIDT